eukprot:Tbor_TRINITY_DN5120_c0_g2::TRINITY_DN5120_c0_g2_i1::g.26162::m.26162
MKDVHEMKGNTSIKTSVLDKKEETFITAPLDITKSTSWNIASLVKESLITTFGKCTSVPLAAQSSSSSSRKKVASGTGDTVVAAIVVECSTIPPTSNSTTDTADEKNTVASHTTLKVVSLGVGHRSVGHMKLYTCPSHSAALAITPNSTTLPSNTDCLSPKALHDSENLVDAARAVFVTESILFDTHAEVMARRGFVSYLLSEMEAWMGVLENGDMRCVGDKICYAEDRSHTLLMPILVPSSSGYSDGKSHVIVGFRPNPRIKCIHLCVSQAPCGDCSIIQLTPSPYSIISNHEEEKYEVGTGARALLTPSLQSPSYASEDEVFYSFGRCESYLVPHYSDTPGHEDYGPHCTHKRRTKPGKGIPTLSMSCTDKIHRWAMMGLEGSKMLSRLIFHSSADEEGNNAALPISSISTVCNRNVQVCPSTPRSAAFPVNSVILVDHVNGPLGDDDTPKRPDNEIRRAAQMAALKRGLNQSSWPNGTNTHMCVGQEVRVDVLHADMNTDILSGWRHPHNTDSALWHAAPPNLQNTAQEINAEYGGTMRLSGKKRLRSATNSSNPILSESTLIFINTKLGLQKGVTLQSWEQVYRKVVNDRSPTLSHSSDQQHMAKAASPWQMSAVFHRGTRHSIRSRALALSNSLSLPSVSGEVSRIDSSDDSVKCDGRGWVKKPYICIKDLSMI